MNSVFRNEKERQPILPYGKIESARFKLRSFEVHRCCTITAVLLLISDCEGERQT